MEELTEVTEAELLEHFGEFRKAALQELFDNEEIVRCTKLLHTALRAVPERGRITPQTACILP